MKSYGVGLLTDVSIGQGVVEYLERIDATLGPFNGKFLIHGDEPNVLEGEHPGSVIVIEFPTANGAIEWYRSDAYQEIVELRTANSSGNVFVVSGVPDDHRATDVLSADASEAAMVAAPTFRRAANGRVAFT